MFFDSTIKLLDAYQTNLGGNPPPTYNGDLLSEVRERLQMLSILYKKVNEAQIIAMSLVPNCLVPRNSLKTMQKGRMALRECLLKKSGLNFANLWSIKMLSFWK